MAVTFPVIENSNTYGSSNAVIISDLSVLYKHALCHTYSNHFRFRCLKR